MKVTVFHIVTQIIMRLHYFNHTVFCVCALYCRVPCYHAAVSYTFPRLRAPQGSNLERNQ